MRMGPLCAAPPLLVSLDLETIPFAVEEIVCTSGSSGNDGWKFQGNVKKSSQSCSGGSLPPGQPSNGFG
jgi:hypothetical protein